LDYGCDRTTHALERIPGYHYLLFAQSERKFNRYGNIVCDENRLPHIEIAKEDGFGINP
jgi:hypothetical protein